jgi:hypothetical protein
LFKSKGTTPSEKLLAETAEKTFLKLWSYPNIFRDQGKLSANGDGKEVCDLLVVFGNHIIIFSDKSCEMSASIDLDLAWRRWYDRAIEKPAKQIFGAERWLKHYPQQVFIDRACKQRLPFELPAPECWQVHRIVVAIGARERCAKEVGGSGSLRIRPTLVGRNHVATGRDDIQQRVSDYQPFEIGWVEPDRGFVHVLDEFTLRTLLEELDTITDLVDYLRQKESLIREGRLTYAAGEEELLWEYLRAGDEKESRSFDGRVALHVCAGNWERWKNHSTYSATKQADEASRRFWDHLIDTFTEKSLGNALLPGSTRSMSDIETCLRVMASEPRLVRRAITSAFVGRMFESAKNVRTWRMIFTPQSPQTGYVFLFYSSAGYNNFEEYRNDRKVWLTGLLMVYSDHNPHLTKLIGIATEAGPDSARRTYELALCAPPKRDGVNINDNTRRLQSALGVKDEEINSQFAMEFEFVPR